jgi:DNA-binding NarL/FixJ family response regulator
MAMTSADPTRVVIVDNHPALRAALRSLLEHEPGLRCIAAVADERELHRIERDVDVVIMDYALGRGDGLGACYRVKQRRRPPAVVLYSAYADDSSVVPAALAQADGVVPKSAPVAVLLDVVRAVATGCSRVPTPDSETIAAACSRLADEDLAVAELLLARVTAAEIAQRLDIPVSEARARALRIIAKMQAGDRSPTPTADAASVLAVG